MQADIATSEVAQTNVTRKFKDLERKYDEIKLSKDPENSKYKAAYKTQKEENEKTQALVRRLNDKFDSQTKLIAESQAREQEYVRRLHEFNDIKKMLEENEKIVSELTAENTQQQVTIAQLQTPTSSRNIDSHRSKRPRTNSDASNAYYSGAEENENEPELPTSIINSRLDKIEQQHFATNKALQQIFQALTVIPNNR